MEEVAQLINDSLRHMAQNKKASQKEVNEFIKSVDKNEDKVISK
jgi:hypothetical protein